MPLGTLGKAPCGGGGGGHPALFCGRFEIPTARLRVNNWGGSEDRENFGWVKNSKIDFSLARNTIVMCAIQSACASMIFHWVKNSNFRWVKNSKIDFSLARNTIVVCAIQSC